MAMAALLTDYKVARRSAGGGAAGYLFLRSLENACRLAAALL